MLCYLLAHIESWLKPDLIIPFSADTSLIAVFYFALGYYSKQFPDNKKYRQIALLFSIFLILGDLLNIYNNYEYLRCKSTYCIYEELVIMKLL